MTNSSGASTRSVGNPTENRMTTGALDGSGGDGRRARTAHEPARTRTLVGPGAQGHFAPLDGRDVAVGALHEAAAVARQVVHHLGRVQRETRRGR